MGVHPQGGFLHGRGLVLGIGGSASFLYMSLWICVCVCEWHLQLHVSVCLSRGLYVSMYVYLFEGYVYVCMCHSVSIYIFLGASACVWKQPSACMCIHQKVCLFISVYLILCVHLHTCAYKCFQAGYLTGIGFVPSGEEQGCPWVVLRHYHNLCTFGRYEGEGTGKITPKGSSHLLQTGP